MALALLRVPAVVLRAQACEEHFPHGSADCVAHRIGSKLEETVYTYNRNEM